MREPSTLQGGSALYRWGAVRQLLHHKAPVLALSSLPLPASSLPAPAACAPEPAALTQPVASCPPAGALPQLSSHDRALTSQGVQLLFSGATDGSIAAWVVNGADDHTEDEDRLQQQQLLQQEQGQQLVWSADGWHQSGVNVMHMAAMPGEAPAMLTSMHFGAKQTSLLLMTPCKHKSWSQD